MSMFNDIAKSEPLPCIPRTSEIASDEYSIRRLCTRLVKEWKELGVKALNIQLEQVEIGITNKIYYATVTQDDVEEENLKRKKVVIRIFGGVGINRERENYILARLAYAKVAPEFIACFGNGRIEGWINGRNILLDEMRLPGIMTQIARRMAEMHHVNIPGELKFSKVWETIGEWTKIAKNVEHGEIKWKVGRLTDWEKEVLLLRKIIQDECMESPVVFCHNDIHPANLYVGGKDNNRVCLLDFEYGDYNYRGFDSK